MKINRLLLAATVPVLTAVSAFAEGSDPAYLTAATQVKQDLTTAVTSLTPIVVAVVTTMIGIWLVPRAVRLVLRMFSIGTGR